MRNNVRRTRRFRHLGAEFVTLAAGLLVVAIFAGLAWQKRIHRAPSVAEMAQFRSHTPPGMAMVPGGDCWLGTDDDDADDDVKPKRKAFVPSFYIDVREVTNEEFHRFDPSHAFAPGNEHLPVTGVTYDQAAAYAKWAGKRLPTEEEWEKAARGTDGRRYPWGDTWDAAKVAARARPVLDNPFSTQSHSETTQSGRVCYAGPPRVRPVGSVPLGVSPYGCEDMAGNAWEWVQGFYNGNAEQRILRGGAVGYGERSCRTYARAIEGSGAT